MDLRQRIDKVLNARTVDDLWDLFTQGTASFGFPNVVYFSHRIFRADNENRIVDGLRLTSLPSALIQDLVANELFDFLPMTGWVVRHHGAKSWASLPAQRASGRLDIRECQAIDAFARFGHTAGIALSLSDRVPRVRAGMLLLGRPGMTQSQIDVSWAACAEQLQLLCHIAHQRLSVLPFHEPDLVLTARQRVALELTGLGFTTQEIAERLELTPATVEKHLRLARKALDARNTSHALVLALARRQIFIDHGEACTATAQRRIKEKSPVTTWSYVRFGDAAEVRARLNEH